MASKDISEKNIVAKIKASSKRAGRETAVVALKLYYALRDNDTPVWVKTVICGALAYFVLPTDLIPDFLPGGYVDDLGTMIAAISGLGAAIKASHVEQAEKTADKFFLKD